MALRDYEVTTTFEDLRDIFLLCKTVNHGWVEVVRSDLEKPEYGWRFCLRCERCSSERHDLIDPRTGDLVGRRYYYPDGYQLDEKVTRSEMRHEWGRRHNYFNGRKHR